MVAWWHWTDIYVSRFHPSPMYRKIKTTIKINTVRQIFSGTIKKTTNAVATINRATYDISWLINETMAPLIPNTGILNRDHASPTYTMTKDTASTTNAAIARPNRFLDPLPIYRKAIMTKTPIHKLQFADIPSKYPLTKCSIVKEWLWPQISI